MKKIFTILAISILTITTTFAQDISLSGLESQFETMGKDLGSAVASSATNGLAWSDAYVGNFPHFGIGTFVGAQIIPVKAFTDLLTVVDPAAELPDELTGFGIPIPSFGFDGRIGGFVIPFDIGVKFAKINDYALGDITFDYSLIGGDIRYAIVKGNLLLPKISVGVGFSRLTTNIAINGILSGNYEILSGLTPAQTLVLKNPDLVYGWESNVLEFKAQISKNLLFFTPALGINAGYSTTKIGGGIITSVTDGNGDEINQTDIDAAVTAAKALGQTVPSIDASGFETYSDTTAWSFKINGGLSFNILILKIDISANYEILSQSYGGQLGFRVQL